MQNYVIEFTDAFGDMHEFEFPDVTATREYCRRLVAMGLKGFIVTFYTDEGEGVDMTEEVLDWLELND